MILRWLINVHLCDKGFNIVDEAWKASQGLGPSWLLIFTHDVKSFITLVTID